MFNSPLPNSLSPSPGSSAASHSLEAPPARYHSTSPSFQLVPLPEGAPPVSFPFSGPSPLSPTSPTARRIGLTLPTPSVGDPGPSSLLHRHRASTSSDSSKGASPASPLQPSGLPLSNAAAGPSASAPSSSAVATTTGSTSRAASKSTFVPPPPPPPLSNPLDLLKRSRQGLSQLIGYGNIDARPSRQASSGAGLKSGACTACRNAKAKCTQRQPACERCVSMQVECVYAVFQKRGRKRTMTPNQALLENCHRDIEQALAILASSSPPHSIPPPLPPIATHHVMIDQTPHLYPLPPTTLTSEEEESGSTKELKDVLENPLALLAHISSLKVGGDSTTDEESGKHFLPQQTSRDAEPTVEGYFATGLYQLRSDADPAYDPVSLGIITEHTLARFVDFYFTALQPFVFHLTASIHTPRFLRDTSPFLTTALACICATFDPSSQSTVPALFNHLQLINTRIWSEGLKSLEIVQAYMLLIHWTPIANNWGDDRRWGWLGTAIRIATEIKLHKTLNQTTYDFYRSVTPLSDDAFQRLSDDRIRSWRLISVCETALGVSTGRLGAISNLCSVWPGPPTPANLTRDHPHYNTYAILELTKIYANGICLSNNVTDSEASTNFDIRGSFKSKWTHDLQQWRQTWVHANQYVRMIYSHNLTILLSIALRFRGPIAPILEECRAQAHETASLAVHWPDDSYKWGSNISVVVIAYAATLLLRIDATKPGPLPPTTIQLCAAVADKLLQTGATRPQTRTLATLHGTRIRTLLAASTTPCAPQPIPSSLLPSDLTSQPSLNDPNIHATFESISKEVHLYPPVFPGTEHLHFTSALSSGLSPSPSAALNHVNPHHLPSSMEGISSSSTSHHLEDQDDQDVVNGIGLKPDSDHLWSLPTSESHMLWDLFHDHRPNPVTDTSPHSHSNPPGLNLAGSSSGGGGGGVRGGGGGGEGRLSLSSLTGGGGGGGGGSGGSGGTSHHPHLPLSPSQLLVQSRPSTSAGLESREGSSSGGDASSGGSTETGVTKSTTTTTTLTGRRDGNRKKKRDRSDRKGQESTMTTTTTTTAPGEDWVHRNALETDWLNSEPGAWAW